MEGTRELDLVGREGLCDVDRLAGQVRVEERVGLLDGRRGAQRLVGVAAVQCVLEWRARRTAYVANR